jgi:heme A synthase
MSQTHTAARQAGRSQVDKLTRLRGASIGAVAMLVLQFILGMIYSLYGTAPTSKKSIGLFSSPTIALHVILGILLFLAALALLVRAIGARHAASIWLSAIGLVSIIGAGFAGLGFAGSGASSASLGMSLAFALALVCYVAMLVVLAPASSIGSAAPPSSTT